MTLIKVSAGGFHQTIENEQASTSNLAPQTKKNERRKSRKYRNKKNMAVTTEGEDVEGGNLKVSSLSNRSKSANEGDYTQESDN